MAMIDRSGLPQRRDLSAARPSVQDDSLFVSDDDNQMEASEPQSENDHLESQTASSLRNISESPAPSNRPSDSHAPIPVTSSQTSNPFQTSEPPKMFSTLFSASSTANNTPLSGSPNPFAAFPSTTPSPFAPSPSPFTMSNPPEAGQEEETPPKTSTSQQPSPFVNDSSMASIAPGPSFAAPNPFAASLSSSTQFKPPEAGHKQETPRTSAVQQSSSISAGSTATTVPAQNPFAASLSAFNPPQAPEPTQEDVSRATSPAQQSSTLFASSSKLAASSEQKTNSNTSTATFTPQLGFPGTSQTTSSSSVFNFSSNPFATRTEQTSSLTTTTSGATQPSANIFDFSKAPTFDGPSQAPLFKPPKDMKAKEAPPKPAQPAIIDSEPAPAPSGQTTVSFGTSAFQSTKSLFPPATTTSTAQQGMQQLQQGDVDAATQPDQADAALPAVSEDSALARGQAESSRPDSQTVATESVTAQADGSTMPSVDIEPAATVGVSSTLATTPVAQNQPICKLPFCSSVQTIDSKANIMFDSY